MRRITKRGPLLGALALLLAVPVTAQTTGGAGVLLRTDGDVSVPSGTQYAVVIVLRGDLSVAGRVGTVIVASGDADFSGADVDDIVVVGGTARLADGTTVSGDVQLVDASLESQEGSRVLGVVKEGARHQLLRGFWVFGALVAIGYALAIIFGALIAAVVAPHGVRLAGGAMTDEPLRVLFWTLGTWALLPIGAIFAIPTVVGIPMGIGVFVFILPTLAFLGYLISAIRLGDGIMGRLRKSVEQPRPYLAALAGATVLLAAGMIPVFGPWVSMVAGAWGSGALLLTLARGIGIPTEPDLGRAVVT